MLLSLPEVDVSVAVGVERPEHVLGKLGGVAVREEVAVNLFELFDRQEARGTVLEKALVPLLNLGLGEVCLFCELGDGLRFEPSLAVTHFLERYNSFFRSKII